MRRCTSDAPCPICGGHPGEPRGQGSRCYGFVDDAAEYAHCTRDELAGVLEMNAGSGGYAHRLAGRCNCGDVHGHGEIVRSVPIRPKKEEPNAEARDTGPVPRETREKLAACGRLRDLDTLARLGARALELRVRRSGEPWGSWESGWFGLPTVGGGWKALQLQANGSATLGRVNVGSASLVLYVEGERPERLYDVEGESDLIAAVDAGLTAVVTGTCGARSIAGHRRHTGVLIETAPSEVVVVMDRDADGARGEELRTHFWTELGFRVVVIHLPESLGPKGDLRDFLRDHTAADLLDLVRESETSATDAEACEASEDWEEPVALDGLDVPDFPLEALPSPLPTYVASIADSREVAADMPGCAVLATSSSAVSAKLKVRIGDAFEEPLNLYFAPAAGSGERKRVIRECIAPIYEIERERIQAALPDIRRLQGERAVAEKRVKRLEDEASRLERGDPEIAEKLKEIEQLREEMVTVPAVPQLVADDMTAEALGAILAAQQERIFVASEEGGTLFGQFGGRYKSVGDADMDLWLKAYDGGPHRVGRMSRDAVVLESPAITCIVTPQPGVLVGLSSQPNLRHRGFLARFLFALPASKVGHRTKLGAGVDPGAEKAYGEVIRSLARLEPPAGAVLQIRGAALELWHQYEQEIERDQLDGGRFAEARDWASKLGGKVARLAGVLHLIKHRADPEPWAIPVEVESVAAAWTLGMYFAEHALAAFALMGEEPNVALGRRIWRWVLGRGKSSFSRHDLHQSLRRSVGDPENLEPGLRLLEARGYLRRLKRRPGKQGGQVPTDLFLVSPIALKRTHSPHNLEAGAGREGCEDSSGESQP